MMSDGESGYGFSHLASMPITLSFGLVLLGVLVALIILRVVFGEIRVGAGTR